MKNKFFGFTILNRYAFHDRGLRTRYRHTNFHSQTDYIIHTRPGCTNRCARIQSEDLCPGSKPVREYRGRKQSHRGYPAGIMARDHLTGHVGAVLYQSQHPNVRSAQQRRAIQPGLPAGCGNCFPPAGDNRRQKTVINCNAEQSNHIKGDKSYDANW